MTTTEDNPLLKNLINAIKDLEAEDYLPENHEYVLFIIGLAASNISKRIAKKEKSYMGVTEQDIDRGLVRIGTLESNKKEKEKPER